MEIVQQPRPKALLRIRPRTGWQTVDIAEIWRYRDLLLTFAVRDVKLRYRQTALGATWVILQPLMAAGIFTFVFGRIAKLPSDGVPYFVLSYAGLLGWNLFASTFTKASSCVVGNSHLVSKVYFPRMVLPLSTVLSSFLDFGVAMGMMAFLMIANHVAVTPTMLMLPVWMIVITILALGVSLYAAALMVTYRDVGYVLPILTQFLLYACPVAYSASAVPASLRPYLNLNPLTGILEAFRWSLLPGRVISWSSVSYSIAFSIVAFILGSLAFVRMERKFADVI